MSHTGPRVGEAVASAFEFCRTAARRAWAVQTLSALGVALVFVSFRGRMSPAEAADLSEIGSLVVLTAAASLWGALYRLELGGAAARGLDAFGLQFGGAELRLIALWLAFVAAVLLVWLPVVAASAIGFVLFRGAGEVTFGALGAVQVSFLIVAALWLAAAGAFAFACARLAFAPAATVACGRLVLRDAWALGRGRTGAVLAAWLLAQAPALLVLVGLAALDSVELRDALGGSRSRWPLPDAALGGLVLGLVAAFVQVPLTVGVLGYLYREGRERVGAVAARNVAPLEAELSPG